MQKTLDIPHFRVSGHDTSGQEYGCQSTPDNHSFSLLKEDKIVPVS